MCDRQLLRPHRPGEYTLEPLKKSDLGGKTRRKVGADQTDHDWVCDWVTSIRWLLHRADPIPPGPFVPVIGERDQPPHSPLNLHLVARILIEVCPVPLKIWSELVGESVTVV